MTKVNKMMNVAMVVLSVLAVIMVYVAYQEVTDYLAYQRALELKTDLENLIGQPVKFTVTK